MSVYTRTVMGMCARCSAMITPSELETHDCKPQEDLLRENAELREALRGLILWAESMHGRYISSANPTANSVNFTKLNEARKALAATEGGK